MRRTADANTIAQVRACLDRCARNGKDPVAELDSLGLIVHPQLVRRIQVQMLEQTVQLLERFPLQQMVKQMDSGKRLTSPLDAQRLIIDWLRQEAQQLANS